MPVGVGRGPQARVAGGRAGDRHFRRGGDAAVLPAVARHAPDAAGLLDLDDGAAVRGHLDVDPLLVGGRDRDFGLRALAGDRDDAGEHQVRVGVLVVDDEEAVLRRAFDRDVADVVVVVAELLRLSLGRLVQRVELGGIREQGIAPAQQDAGVIARCDVVVGVDAGLDLGEVEGEAGRALGPGLGGGEERERRDGRADRRRRHRAAEEAAAREAGGDDLAHGAVCRGVAALADNLLELAGPENGAAARDLHGSPLLAGGWLVGPARPLTTYLVRHCRRSMTAMPRGFRRRASPFRPAAPSTSSRPGSARR